MSTPRSLPDSGDGLAPPRPDELQHPALWSDPPPSQAPRAFEGSAQDDADIPAHTRGRELAIYGAVAAMLVAAALLGLAFVLRSLPLGIGAVVLGLLGTVVAYRAKILQAVTVGQSARSSA